jgi:hypothetical protein
MHAAIRSRAALPSASNPSWYRECVGETVARSCAWIALASGTLAALLLQPRAHPQHAKGAALALELVRMGPEGQLRTPDSFLSEDRFKVMLTCPPAWRGFADVLTFQEAETTAPLATQRIDSCGNRRALQGAFRLTGSAAVTMCVVFSANAPLDRDQLPNMPSAQAENWVCQTLQPTRLP